MDRTMDEATLQQTLDGLADHTLEVVIGNLITRPGMFLGSEPTDASAGWRCAIVRDLPRRIKETTYQVTVEQAVRLKVAGAVSAAR